MMSSLLARVAAVDSLTQAWLDILDKDREDEQLAPGVRRFSINAEDEITRLHHELDEGSFLAKPLTRWVIPKDDGTRTLHIPAVRDRVVERTILRVITPLIDPLLGSTSYAYRPGLGVSDAIQAVVRLRNEGLRWVVRADIDNCFPSIDLPRVRRHLGILLDDPDLLTVIDQLLDRPSDEPGGLRRISGLAQGCALSPLLANLALVHFDDRLIRAGFPVVRYSDDFVIAADSRTEAAEALRHAHAALEEIGMTIGADNVEVMSFDDGFSFLGEDFGPKYPPELDDHRIVEPLRRVLYAGVQGGRVRVLDGKVVVETPDDTRVLEVPTGHVERIVRFGSIGLSAGARSWALANDIEVAFVSRRGTYLGELTSASSLARAARLRAQFAAADDPTIAMPVARAIVAAKLHKQLVVLKRLARRHNAELVTTATTHIEQLESLIPDAGARDELMGLEGAAARAYFDTIGQTLPEKLRFETRSRRPPQDVANSALSFGYAVLLAEAVSALVAVGLHPSVGLLHTEHDDRPSLALDLLEEFRPLVVDQVVLACAQRGELRADHGRREETRPGVLLTRAGRETLLTAYERRMLQRTSGALPGFSGSLRRHLYRQAERLAATILRRDEWTGLSWR